MASMAFFAFMALAAERGSLHPTVIVHSLNCSLKPITVFIAFIAFIAFEGFRPFGAGAFLAFMTFVTYLTFMTFAYAIAMMEPIGG